MQTASPDHCATNAVPLGSEQSTGNRATIEGTSGTLLCTERGVAVHIWSAIGTPGSSESPPDGTTSPFSSGTWPEAFARRNPQSD